jgi:hypothetical protein
MAVMALSVLPQSVLRNKLWQIQTGPPGARQGQVARDERRQVHVDNVRCAVGQMHASISRHPITIPRAAKQSFAAHSLAPQFAFNGAQEQHVRIPFWIVRLRLLRPQQPEPMNRVAHTQLTILATASAATLLMCIGPS